MNALLLTAGLGTRFRPFTNILPKPAIPLLNVPIAFYNLHLCQQLGLDKLTANLHHLPQKMQAVFESAREQIGIPIFYSDESDLVLGTGGAIKQARPTLEGRGTFIVANADVVNGFGIRDALESHHKHQPMATMIVMKHPEAGKKYGAVWADEEGVVVGIGKEKPEVPCEPYHFVGVHLIEESVFKYIPDGPCDINKDVYLRSIKEGETVRVHKKEGFWFDAGSLDDYLKATDDLLQILPRLQHQPFFLSLFRRFWANFDKRPNLWEGERCEHLLSLGSQSKILLDRYCHINPSARVSGFAVFGQGCIIEKDVELENVVVGAGVRVKEGSRLSNTLVLE